MGHSINVNRRRFLAGVSAISIGVSSGCTEIVSGIIGPPEPGELVREMNVSGSYFTKISLFDNGVAQITLRDDHGDYKRIGFTHVLHDLDYGQVESNAYAIWDAPEFAGPITVDLKGPIQDHGPYPSPNFKLRLLAEEGSVIFRLGGPSITVGFPVPDSYLPSEDS